MRGERSRRILARWRARTRSPASILEAGAATEDQVDELEAAVEDAARDPATVFYQARIHQGVGRRRG
jgi:hypothetical protein